MEAAVALREAPCPCPLLSILGMNSTTEDRSRAVFTARLVVMERPELVEEMSRRAAASGRSLSAEVRAAIGFGWMGGPQKMADTPITVEVAEQRVDPTDEPQTWVHHVELEITDSSGKTHRATLDTPLRATSRGSAAAAALRCNGK